MTRKFWTKEEDNLVIEKFPHVNTIEIAKVLNRSYGSVARRANFLQLKKTDEFMKSDLSGRNNNLSNLGINRIVCKRRNNNKKRRVFNR